MVSINDLTITSLETLTFYTIAGDYWFTLDEPQEASIEQSEDKTDITGKQGRKISTLKRNKTVTISGTNGLISGGLLEGQTGGDFETVTNKEVLWTDYLTVTEDGGAYTATLTKTPSATEDSLAIDAIYVRESDGILGKKFLDADQYNSSSSGAGYFTYADGVVTFTGGDATALAAGTADVTAGSEVVVYYKTTVSTAATLENVSDEFSGKAQVFIDADAEDKCANVYHVQIYIPKGDFSGEYTLSFGDDQTTHEFEIEALAGSCGDGNVYFTYTVFEDGVVAAPSTTAGSTD